MKKAILRISICALTFITLVAVSKNDSDTKKTTLTENFITGNPGISSINALSFGPEGILFIGDSKNAAIYALDTKDNSESTSSERLVVREVDNKIAASLGTTSDKIRVTDMAVNPKSRLVYFSVNVADGTPVILKLNGDTFENVNLTEVSYSKIDIENAVSVDKKDRRGRSQRALAISDLKYHDGKVMVSGLSNKEFSSTFRSINFPFDDTQDHASLEIYHAAHGKYETYAPIRTFNVVNIDNKDYLMASYTCTPLVLFPMDELKGGTHVKGRTVAELGAGNSPLDMITFNRDGKPYFLMANTNRPVMRIDYDAIKSFKSELTEPVKGYKAEGLSFTSLPMVNVLQLDNLDSNNVVYLQRTSGGELVLVSRPTNRI